MNRPAALGVLLLLAALTALALVAPWHVPLAMVLLAVPLVRGGRSGYLLFAASALVLNALLLALVVPGGPALRLGPVSLGAEGAWRGLAGGLRLTAALGANLAVLTQVGAARLVDGLRLPASATALLAAVVLSAHDVGADFRRLRTARALEGDWPRGRVRRAREAARLLPALMLAAHRRARVRRDALRLAGHDTRPWFVPLVAVAALAAAGRLAFLAFPNVALTYVVVFLGGLLFGPLVAAAGGALGMAVTDFLLTGLYPLGFVNVPAMALLGLAGGLLRGFDFEGATRADRVAARCFAASAGLLGTFLFSAVSDLGTWLVVAGGEPDALAPLLLAGLAFNVVPAFVNAILFAAALGPTLRAFRAAGEAPARGGPQARGAPASRGDPPPEPAPVLDGPPG